MALVLIRGLRKSPGYVEPATAVVNFRQCSDKKTQAPKLNKYSREAVKMNVKGYVFTRYIDHVKNYDKVLEKNFPSAMRVYRVFLDGVAAFYKDMKRYLKITRILSGSAQGMQSLTRSELELYYQMPRDMYKVAPAIFVSSLPVVGYAALPLAYMFPRTFLTSHFWSLQQKVEFQQFYLKARLTNNRNVLRCLQAKLDKVKETPYHTRFNHMLGLLGSGLHPTKPEILDMKDLFAMPPYQFSSLPQKYIKQLCYIHGLRAGIFGRDRLLDRADAMHHMDLAIRREGGVHNMIPEALKNACLMRGLNPANMSNEKMIEWLRDWVDISLAIEEQHNSLFLHLPILLAYNHPNNWRLIYK